MQENNGLKINLDRSTYLFFNEIAKASERTVEDVLSDTLLNYVDLMRKMVDEHDKATSEYPTATAKFLLLPLYPNKQ